MALAGVLLRPADAVTRVEGKTPSKDVKTLGANTPSSQPQRLLLLPRPGRMLQPLLMVAPLFLHTLALDEQRRLRQEVDRLTELVGMAEQQAGLVDIGRLAEWEREVDPTLFSISCPRHAAPDNVRRALASWIAAAQLTPEMVELYGNIPARRFWLRTRGGPPVALPRALALGKALRTGTEWRTFETTDVDNAPVRLYVNPDKTAPTIRKDIHTRKMQLALQKVAPGHTWRAVRARGEVHSAGTPVVRLGIRGQDEDTIVQWNHSAADHLRLDKPAVLREFRASTVTADTRRLRKLRVLSEHLRRGAVVVIQEVHGSEVKLKQWLDAQPFEYDFRASFLSARAGGVATLWPRCLHAGQPIQARHILLARGRVMLHDFCHQDSHFQVRLLNVHNYELPERARQDIGRCWRQAVEWAAQDHQHRLFIAVDDFNIGETVPQSYEHPNPRHATLRPRVGHHAHASSWQPLFDLMLEVAMDTPTHFDRQHYSANSLDRIFLSLPTSDLAQLDMQAEVLQDVAGMSDSRLSDHVVVRLSLGFQTGLPNADRSLPAFIFKNPLFGAKLGQLLELSHLDHLPVVQRWQCHKQLMRLAAQFVRDHSQRLPGDDRSPLAKQGRLVTLRAIARACWRQDARVACLLRNSTDLGALHIDVVDGTVVLSDPQEFARVARVANETEQVRIREAAARRAREAWAANQPLAAEGLRRAERVAVRRDLAWAPFRRRVVLAGIRIDDSSAGDQVASDSQTMLDAIRGHWGPIFMKPPAPEEEIAAYINQHMPASDVLDLAVPSEAEVKAALRTGRRSQPGPDGFTYDAWLQYP
ncbi:unnamed protein product, partial [Prorocentrum cordatum]